MPDTKTRPMPASVECPDCGRMVPTVRRVISRHSTYPTGPLCASSGAPVTVRVLEATRNMERARMVLHWAHVLRNEDPAHVWRWIAQCERRELEALMCVALAAVNPEQSTGQTFAWVRMIGWMPEKREEHDEVQGQD